MRRRHARLLAEKRAKAHAEREARWQAEWEEGLAGKTVRRAVELIAWKAGLDPALVREGA